jgi:hypothetical protein
VQPRVSILMVPCVAEVKIRQFWKEKWTEVPPSLFSHITGTVCDKNESTGGKK